MKKILVTYYTKTGSNAYLAQRFAKALDADLEEIHPRFNNMAWLVIRSLLGQSVGIKPLEHDPSNYDAVIISAPIWMGKLISPVHGLLKKYKGSFKALYFAPCCGGGDKEKDGKFGYESVFQTFKSIPKFIPVDCRAFPIPLVLPENQREDGDLVMKTKLSDDNFTGEILDRFDDFVKLIKSS
jgi:menaquinone-dependent protoporphyrinogen IX oxidase